MKIFVSIPKGSEVEQTFFPDTVKAYLEERFTVSYNPLERQVTPEEFTQYTKDADAVLTGWGHPVITGDMVQGTSLRLVAHTGGSVGSLADGSLYDAGVRVISGNLLYAESVAEGALAYMFMGLRRLPYYTQKIREGLWREPGDQWDGLYDRTVGIIGFGTISRLLIDLLQPFHVNIKIQSHYPIDPDYLQQHHAAAADLDEIFSTCDIVSVHSSMNERTRGMITGAHFAQMKEGALFLNTARGAVIREEEMIEELRKNRFFAVLDVFCQEPLALDSPLRKLSNVWCIPHMAGPTLDRRPAVTRALADDMVKFSSGGPLRLEISAESAKRMTVGG